MSQKPGGMSTFEAIKHTADDFGEYWSGRELMEVLEYSTWQKFSAVIKKAIKACDTAGFRHMDHFNLEVKSIPMPKGATRQIDDYRLSRYACYLIVQNGDPSKPIIALGQTYFAVQ